MKSSMQLDSPYRTFYWFLNKQYMSQLNPFTSQARETVALSMNDLELDLSVLVKF